MKSRCPHSSSARWTLLLLALAVSTATGFAQNVAGFIHGKIQNFQQTSPAAPVVNSTAPFQFGSLITMGTATINSATLTFTGTASPRTYDPVVGTGDFSILDTFTTQALLDSAYQNGNFTVSINTSAGTFSRTIFLFPFSYPTTAMLTVPAGNWQSGNLVIDPTLDYTFTWNAFANAQAADVIELVIRNSGLAFNPFPATQTSFTLPAGSLQPGTIYTSDLAFVRVAGVTAADADIGPGYATLVKDTGFTISTIAATPTPSPTATPIVTPTPPVPTPTPTPSATTTPLPSATPTPTPTPPATPTPSATPGKLGNISTRLRVLGGDNVLIGGMIVTGTAPKRVIIRAIGPSLTGFGVPGALANPTLELFQGSTLLFSNDDWNNSTQQAEIAASGFAPGNTLESAIIWTLTPGQGYTAIVRGNSGATGVGVVEAYDLDQAAASKLGNISTRGFVDVDDNVMIAGLIVTPSNGASLKVLVRALGPTLSDFGVPGALANPTLDLVNASGTVIRSNNNWKDDPQQRALIEAAGLAPTHDEEAALVETVAPGAYTAVVRGNNRTTGVGLVEAYNIP
ncbi:MAG: hypothetical protein QOC70_1531 [Verrucomicrobiota bacterium]|jgi:hypothetical protein